MDSKQDNTAMAVGTGILDVQLPQQLSDFPLR